MNQIYKVKEDKPIQIRKNSNHKQETTINLRKDNPSTIKTNTDIQFPQVKETWA